MENNNSMELPSSKSGIQWITNNLENSEKMYMGSRRCDNCGQTKDTSGGKTCSKGHFLCHSCASRHEHCTLCGHTLR